ncbi:MAG TPA: hypothetical protein VHC18_14780 [Amycolatopsis sp.]|nr:hypothetical protein [Amycolatopsis sp.]
MVALPGGDFRVVERPRRLGLAAGIAGPRGEARGDHVSVSVDVRGKIVGLEIAHGALKLGPDRLAAEIRRLAAEVGTAVLRDGLRAVRAGCPPEVAAALEDLLEPRSPAQEPTPPDEEEFFTLTRA